MEMPPSRGGKRRPGENRETKRNPWQWGRYGIHRTIMEGGPHTIEETHSNEEPKGLHMRESRLRTVEKNAGPLKKFLCMIYLVGEKATSAEGDGQKEGKYFRSEAS